MVLTGTGSKVWDIYEKKQVTEGNVRAIRAESTASYAHSSGGWWIVEQPHGRPGKTSMWKLDEFQQLRAEEDVFLYTFDQCRFGCMAEKKTDFLSNIPGMDEFTCLCNHEPQTWVVPWSGEVIIAPHPPLRGKQWAIPEAEWSPSMLRDAEPQGDYITRARAAYPEELNRAIAKALCRRRKTASASHESTQVQQSLEPTKVKKLIPLRGKEEPDKQPDARNSLRDVYKWVTDRARYNGIQVRNMIFQVFDKHPEVETRILDSLGRRSNDDVVNATWMQNLREKIPELLVRNKKPDMEGTCDTSEIDEEGYRTCIRGRLLEYWARVVDDPGRKCTKGTYQGAPAGLEIDTSDLDGVFPQVMSEEEEAPWDALTTEYDTFQNYMGIEDDDEAYMKCWKDTTRRASWTSLTACKIWQEKWGDPTLSKLGCIKKTKINMETGEAVTKSRIILDCKRSSVSKAAKRTHKAVLPRVTDAVQSLLRTMARSQEGVTMLIADITDAFWLIPLKKE